MGGVQQLGYIGIGTRDLGLWGTFATDVLGHQISPDSDEQTLFLRMDERHHRLSVHATDEEDLAYLGWCVGSPEQMQAVAAQLDARDIAVTAAKPEEAADRRVIDFVHFVDPNSGIRMELHYGPEIIFSPPFHPQRPVTGFKTGELGLGHIAVFVADVESAVPLYQEVLGFGVSDWLVVPGLGRIGAFLHCNRRHHSFALFANPAPRTKVHHVMMEYTALDDVGSGYDLCLERDIVTATLGRHLNDRMFSFYFKNPGGWHFEVGWDAREIDPATWQVEHYNGLTPGGGEWGHAGLLEMM